MLILKMEGLLMFSTLSGTFFIFPFTLWQLDDHLFVSQLQIKSYS